MSERYRYQIDAPDVQLPDGSFLMVFPIGDWSGDGHMRSEEYMVRSKKPVKDVREAHFRAPERLGFEIGDICGEYEESKIKEEILAKINPLGYEFKDSDEIDGAIHPTGREVVNLWTFLLNKVDPALELEVIAMPSVNFYGHDSQNRHLGVPGYGIFGQ